MDLAKLAKRIRNELVRNPKKTAILAVICLVALYFWAPLIQGWIPGGKPKTVAKVAPQTPVAETTSEAPSSEHSKATAKADAAFRWDKVLALRSRDPLMSSARLAGGNRDPFGMTADVRQALAEQKANAESESTPASTKLPVEPTPSELGLVLKGTLMGPRGKAATLGSRTYLEGSVVSLGGVTTAGQKESDVDPVEFTLTAVHKDQVVLTRGEKSYTLAFPRTNLSPGERIVRTLLTPEEQ